MWVKRLFLFVVACLLQDGAQAQTLDTDAMYANATTTRECALRQMQKPNCDRIKYPPIEGSCNNPLNPFAGMARTPYKRLLPPSFGDGIKSFRRSVLGGALPPARTISNLLNSGNGATNAESTTVNGMFVQFAQYMIHDMADTQFVNEENGVAVSCACSNPSPSCINVPIPPGDPHYRPTTTCIPLKGAKVVSGCDELPREKLNGLTAYIDAETIYGNYKELLADLRDPNSDSGELLLQAEKPTESGGCPMHRNNKLLPKRTAVSPSVASTIACPAHFNSACFVSGERRLNENIALTSAHLLFAREHNRVAKRLKTLNSHWDSEMIFQEARRIMKAVHQIITYGELVPLLLGRKLTKDFDLELVNEGYYFGYDSSFDASISNSFVVAAFRYGHSQVGTHYHRPGPDYVTEEAPSVPTFRGLFQQAAVWNGTAPAIMRGIMIDPARIVDTSFVDDLRNRMFESSTQVGQDLLAINIQRGRGHGLATYNRFREFCGLQRATQWSDYLDVMKSSTVEKLRLAYRHVDDVDLYVGGLAETPLDGAAVGPVFGCIIGHQFRDVRKGDRFWYANPGEFSEDQLRELRKVKLSRVLCDNMEGMETAPPSALELPGEFNSRVACTELPQVNLASWKEYNHRQDGDWTRWFPTVPMGSDIILQKILDTDSNSACKNPLDIQMVPFSELRQDMYKVRFFCPKGSIRTNSFPNAKSSLNYYWTSWFDRDTPGADGDDIEILGYLRLERPGEICENPLYMQAQTKERESALDSSEVFLTLNPREGLQCRGEHQPSGSCKDYRVRFYCPADYRDKIIAMKYSLSHSAGNMNNSDNYWTTWFNLGNPRNGHYDVESFGYARYRGSILCRRPLLIEGRVAGSDLRAEDTGDVLKRYSVYHGLVCDNRDQLNGRCHDYKVRYLCPRISSAAVIR